MKASPGERKNSEREFKSELRHANLLDELMIYTDGACYRNGREDAQASLGIWFDKDHPLNVSKVVPLHHKQTNNTAEILAAVEAVKQSRVIGNKNVCIVTDSELLANAWQKAVKVWQLNGWKTAAGKPVKHRRELALLISEVGKTPGMSLRIVHVPGHGSCEGNNEADRLAGMAIQSFVDKKNEERARSGYLGEPMVYTRSVYGTESKEGTYKSKKERIRESYERVQRNLAQRKLEHEEKLKASIDRALKNKEKAIEEEEVLVEDKEILKITFENDKVKKIQKKKRKKDKKNKKKKHRE